MSRATYRLLTRLIAWVVGTVGALLLARLLARLLAGRAENPVLHLLYNITDPLVAPLARLNAGQPHFGAVLELSTLVALVLLLTVGYGVWRLLRVR